MLIVEGACKKYKQKTVLNNICLRIGEKECVSLIGESGCGKSTLCRLTLGFEACSAGRVIWNGEDIRRIAKKKYYKDVQAVFQDNTSCLNPRLKIIDSLTEPLRHFTDLDRTQMKLKALSLLEKVELLPEVADMYPHELSGGMQKRVCIARAISASPKLVLLDEAVSGLDATTTLKVLKLLKKLQSDEEFSYLFISHNLKAALFMSDRIAIMKDGQITDIYHDVQSVDDVAVSITENFITNKEHWRNKNEANEKGPWADAGRADCRNGVYGMPS